MLAKKAMDQPHQCKYCGTKFHKESTLSTHMCVKKRRHMEIDSKPSRFGFAAFRRFFELTTSSKKVKTTDDFINSPYYIDFVKFGVHLADLKPIHNDKYIDFVIMNGVKLKDWTKDFVYEAYISDLVKKEPAASATDRSITEIMAWCDANAVDFSEFFKSISPNEAAHLIKTGKLSPWVLYLSSSGDILLQGFNEDHANMIGTIIDPGFWMKKFRNMADDVDYIKDLLYQSGL